MTFPDVVRLNDPRRLVQGGDSGAACPVEVKNGVYQMAAILFGGTSADADGPGVGRATAATVAEAKLKITFGKRAPAAA